MLSNPSTRSSAGNDVVGSKEFSVHSKKIANRVAVLVSVEPPESFLTARRKGLASDFKLTRDRGDKSLGLFGRRLRLIFGRHLTEIDDVQDFLPVFG